MLKNRTFIHCYHLSLIVLSSLLFFLSFPNPLFLYGAQGLGFLCLVPAWYVLSQTYSIKSAGRYGMLFGFLSTLLAYYWLTRFGEYSVWTLSGVAFVYIVEYGMLFVLIWLILKYQHKLYTPLLLALLWTGFEYIKSRGFLGFPWTLLAQSVHDFLPIIQIARLTGTWGISFLLAYSNAIIVEWILYEFRSRRHFCLNENAAPTFLFSSSSRRLLKMHALCISVLLALTLGYGGIQLLQSKKFAPEKKVSMLLVQQNLDSWAGIPREKSIASIMNLTKDALRKIEDNKVLEPQLIVWSETSLVVPYQLEENSNAKQFYSTTPKDESFIQFMQRSGVPLLTGTPWVNYEQGIAYNSAVLVSQNSTIQGRYGKNQLVPFAELIPFFDNPKFRTLIENMLGLYGTWLPSGSFNTIDVELRAPNSTINNSISNKERKKSYSLNAMEYFEGNLPIAVPICFEDSFSHITRKFKKAGAKMLLNITNVSWSKTKVAQVQQFAAARFRSIETGLVLVRSTNSGLTSVIDPWGRVLASIPMFEANTLSVDVPLYELDNSLYMFWGDFIGIFAAVLMSLYCICLLIRVYFIRKY